jgi:hypothetical protein
MRDLTDRRFSSPVRPRGAAIARAGRKWRCGGGLTSTAAIGLSSLGALIAVCVAIGMPTPSIVVYSGASQDGSPPFHSSLHCYWVLNRTLSVEEWRSLARAFKTALQKHGLVFDLNVPSNVAGILRPLVSVNRKYDPPRVARLAFSDPDCDLDAIRSALAHIQPRRSENIRAIAALMLISMRLSMSSSISRRAAGCSAHSRSSCARCARSRNGGRLARDGWDQPVVLNAIEYLTGRRDVGLARWAQRRAAL